MPASLPENSRRSSSVALGGTRRAVALHAGQVHRLGLAICIGDGLRRSRPMPALSRGCAEQVLRCWSRSDTRVSPTRAVPVQGGAGLAADPDRQRLLHRFGLEGDAVEVRVGAVRSSARPRLASARKVSMCRSSVTAPGASNGVVTTASYELGLQSARADADHQAPARMRHVERRQHLGGEHGRTVRHDEHAATTAGRSEVVAAIQVMPTICSRRSSGASS